MFDNTSAISSVTAALALVLMSAVSAEAGGRKVAPAQKGHSATLSTYSIEPAEDAASAAPTSKARPITLQGTSLQTSTLEMGNKLDTTTKGLSPDDQWRSAFPKKK